MSDRFETAWINLRIEMPRGFEALADSKAFAKLWFEAGYERGYDEGYTNGFKDASPIPRPKAVYNECGLGTGDTLEKWWEVFENGQFVTSVKAEEEAKCLVEAINAR
jgi:hypothetical protein